MHEFRGSVGDVAGGLGAGPGSGSGPGPAGTRWRSWREALLSWVYPEACQVCEVERAVADEGYVCTECRRRPGHVKRIVPPYCARCGLPYSGAITGTFVCSNCADLDLGFSFARAAVVATPFLLGVLHRYKYGRERWFARFLGPLLVEAAAPELKDGGWDALVPVPLHPAREREREFNQAVDLARCLSAATGIPVAERTLRRGEATRTQALLERDERVKNVAGAFRLRRAGRVPGPRLVVVDDVLTTGATTGAVASALRQGGAREVAVWTLARAV